MNAKLLLLTYVTFLALFANLSSEELKKGVNSSKEQSTEFVSKQGGYSIQFPLGWELREGFMGTDVVALAPVIDLQELFRVNINIIYSKLEVSATRDEYYDLNLKVLNQQLEDFDLESNKDVKLDGVDAKEFIFTHTLGIVNAKVLQYLVLNGDKAYVITFTADPNQFKNYKDVFDQIAASFKFEKTKV